MPRGGRRPKAKKNCQLGEEKNGLRSTSYAKKANVGRKKKAGKRNNRFKPCRSDAKKKSPEEKKNGPKPTQLNGEEGKETGIPGRQL